MRKLVLVVVMLSFFLPAVRAGELKGGDVELGVNLSRVNLDFGSAYGMDLGTTTTTRLEGQIGWFLAARHEIGAYANYLRTTYKNPDFGSSTMDDSDYGVFYAFHFVTSGSILPFVGVAAGLIGGDTGDSYDMEYALLAGFKLYPWEHAGFNVDIEYGKLTASQQGAPDATGVWVNAGILLKF
ncbi:MAG: hypothetical protein D6718_04455 [Acidobacteria bacterium]|nr:MAG: hypothetical protein D6718_04455 [Acidobacteriota bacterium]